MAYLNHRCVTDQLQSRREYLPHTQFNARCNAVSLQGDCRCVRSTLGIELGFREMKQTLHQAK